MQLPCYAMAETYATVNLHRTFYPTCKARKPADLGFHALQPRFGPYVGWLLIAIKR